MLAYVTVFLDHPFDSALWTPTMGERISQILNKAVAGERFEWALDFVSDALVTGRGVRVWAIVDAFTRECLTLGQEEYNCERPHSSLGHRTPNEFAEVLKFSMMTG